MPQKDWALIVTDITEYGGLPLSGFSGSYSLPIPLHWYVKEFLVQTKSPGEDKTLKMVMYILEWGCEAPQRSQTQRGPSFNAQGLTYRGRASPPDGPPLSACCSAGARSWGQGSLW